MTNFPSKAHIGFLEAVLSPGQGPEKKGELTDRR